MSEVFVSNVRDDPMKNIVWLLSKLDLPSKLENICIKANLNDYRRWETASTCDPHILAPILDVLKSQFPSATITVIENDATGVNANNIFAYLGIDSVVEKHNCRFLNVANEEWVSVNIDGLHFTKLEIPRILESCDLFITFPKLKSHVKTKMTCSLKNQMGLFRPKRKVIFHHILDDLIVDCNLAMKPTMTIVDGNLAMEGNYGPTYGTPRKLGLLVASRDIVAADSLCARLFRLNPKSIGHIWKAHKKGLGNTKYKVRADFDFNLRDFRLKFNPLLFHVLRSIAGGLAP